MRLESFSINGKRLTSLTFTSPRLRSPACVSPWTKRACRQIDYKTHKDVLEKHLRIDFSLNVSLNGVVVGEMCKVLGVVKLKSVGCKPVTPGRLVCDTCLDLRRILNNLQFMDKRRVIKSEQQLGNTLTDEQITEEKELGDLEKLFQRVKNPICRWKDCGKKLDDIKSLIDHVRIYHLPTQSGPPSQREYRCLWENCSTAARRKKDDLMNHITDKHTGKATNKYKIVLSTFKV